MLRFLAALALVATSLPLRADPPRVATDIAPVHSLVAMVMQEIATPDLILPPGASPHSYALRPSEAFALESADLVFWVGDDLTPWLVGPIETLTGKAGVITLRDVPGTKVLPLRDGETGIDPHLWLDPDNAKTWLQEIAEQLSSSDPENAAIYRENTALALAEIDQMAAQIRAQLTQIEGLKYITYHDSFQYFERAFALPSSGTLLPGDAAPPGPAHLAQLHDWVLNAGITCLLSEPGASSGLIANVLDGSDAQIVSGDPIGGVLTPGPDLYQLLLLDLAKELANCR